MSKAKSRLKPSLNSKHRLELPLKKYAQHLPLLFLGLIFCGIIYWFLTNISPLAVKNWLLPNTYLPLLVLVFLMNFFFFSFIFLNSRRGLMLALMISIILFFKLQPIINWHTPALFFSGLLLSIEVMIAFRSHR